MRTQNNVNTHEGVAGPPLLLIYSLFTLLILIVIGVIAAIGYFSSGRLISIVPYVIAALAVIVVATILGAVLFRRGMPRWVLPAIVIFWALAGVIGAFGAVAVYQNVLPPRYQAELLTPLPFMRAFLPGTPEGGIVPTVAVDQAQLSVDDLLGLTVGESTEEAIETPNAEATLEAASSLNSGVAVAFASGDATETSAPTATATIPAATATPAPATPTANVPPPTAVNQPVSLAATSVPAISSPAVPSSARMFGFTHIQQGWNNCGPANITMALSLYGWRESQDYAAQFLKPNDEDKNVSPHEMVAFVNEQTGVRAVTRVGGDMNLLKQFIANNFPVIIETAYFPAGYDWIGHYHTVVGYDDNAGAFYVYDSFLGTGEGGAGISVPYPEFDLNWSAFNRVFIVLYEREREGLVQQILGNRAVPEEAARHALQVAQEEARANPRNMYAWFNIGSSLTRLGEYEDAARAFDRARSLDLPFRMMWYQFGAFEAYFNVGRYQDVMVLVDTNLTNGAEYVEETYYWQGRVLEAQGDRAGAVAAFQRALIHNNRYQAAREALDSLG